MRALLSQGHSTKGEEREEDCFLTSRPHSLLVFRNRPLTNANDGVLVCECECMYLGERHTLLPVPKCLEIVARSVHKCPLLYERYSVRRHAETDTTGLLTRPVLTAAETAVAAAVHTES